ncbi:MAG: WYL domain-containing protein [Muribaculaceae bacterium]|nr:WYL domain-containing protein [Muribaculaceae bacterium]
MPVPLLRKYFWLIDTIYNAVEIPFKDINAKWQRTDMSDGKPLPLRTFHAWCESIQEAFSVNIENRKRGRYGYYIENAEELKNGPKSWLLSTISTGNMLLENADMRHRILTEDIPSSQIHLSDFINAMRNGYTVEVDYWNFHLDIKRTFDICPYGLKLFRQRWYVLGKFVDYDQMIILSLDRIQSLKINNERTFDFPADFSVEEYFSEYYGIIRDEGMPFATIRLKVKEQQAKYIRTLPLHHSQVEESKNDEYSIYSLRLRPTFDFKKEILSMGDLVEVLEPQWFRAEVAEDLNIALKQYNHD